MPSAGKTWSTPRRKRPLDATKAYALTGFSTAAYLATAAGGGEAGDAAGFGVFLVARMKSLMITNTALISRSDNAAAGWLVAGGTTAQGRFYIVNSGFKSGGPGLFTASDVGKIFVLFGQSTGALLKLLLSTLDTTVTSGITGITTYSGATTLGLDFVGGTQPAVAWDILAASTIRGVPTRSQIDSVMLLARTLGDLPSKAATEAIMTAPTTGDSALSALAPHSWYRPDSNTQSGGKVTAWVDKQNGSYTLAQATTANQVSAPAADAFFGGQPVATFVSSAATYYTSNRPASDWAFLHNGPCELVFVYVSTATTGGMLFCTRAASTSTETGLSLLRSANTVQVSIGNGNATQPLANQVVYSHVTQPGYEWIRHGSAQTPNIHVEFLDGAGGLALDAAYGAAPGGATPQSTLVLGARAGGALPQDFKFADLIIFDRLLTNTERQTARDYIAARYRFYGYTSGLTHRWSLRDALISRGDPMTGQLTPSYLLDSVTAAAADTMNRTGANRTTLQVLDPATYPRTSYGLLGASTTSRYESVANAGIRGTATGLTVVCVTMFTSTSGSEFVAACADASTSKGWALYRFSSGLSFYAGNGSSAVGPSKTLQTTDLFLPALLHLVCNGTTVEGYFNGVSVGTATCVYSPPDSTIKTSIGDRVLSGAPATTQTTYALHGADVAYTAAEVTAQVATWQSTGQLVAPAGKPFAQSYTPTQDVADAGGISSLHKILDRVGTSHLTAFGIAVRTGPNGIRGIGGHQAGQHYAASAGPLSTSGVFHLVMDLWLDALATSSNTILASGSGPGFYFHVTSSGFRFVQSGVAVTPYFALNSGHLNTRLRVIVQHTGTSLQMQVNGSAVADTATSAYTASGSACYLGCYSPSTEPFTCGTVELIQTGGNNLTAGEIATLNASLTSAAPSVAGKTQKRWVLTSDVTTANGLPQQLAERVSGASADTFLLAGNATHMVAAPRSERLWSLEASPILYGGYGWTLSDYYATATNLGDTSTQGCWIAALFVVTDQSASKTRDIFGSANDSPNRGMAIRSQGSNTAVTFVMHDDGNVARSPTSSAINATDVGKLLLYVGIWDKTNMKARGWFKRAESGTGTTVTGYTPNTQGLRVGRNFQTTDRGCDGIVIHGVAAGLGLPTTAQLYALYDQTMANERLSGIPGLTTLRIDLTADAAGNGNVLPATLVDRASGSFNLSRTGAVPAWPHYARMWSW